MDNVTRIQNALYDWFALVNPNIKTFQSFQDHSPALPYLAVDLPSFEVEGPAGLTYPTGSTIKVGLQDSGTATVQIREIGANGKYLEAIRKSLPLPSVDGCLDPYGIQVLSMSDSNPIPRIQDSHYTPEFMATVTISYGSLDDLTTSVGTINNTLVTRNP